MTVAAPAATMDRLHFLDDSLRNHDHPLAPIDTNAFLEPFVI
jgi:hypothetical protein